MPIRPNVAETVQIGVEGTPGTAVAANVRLGSLGIVASAAIGATANKPTGYKYATMSQVTTDQANLALSGAPAYIESPYVWSGIIGAATVETPSNGDLTRDWTFASDTTGADTFVAFSVEQGNNAIRAQHAKQARFAEVTFNFSRQNGCSWAGSGFAQRLHDNKVRYLTIVGTGGTFTVTVGGQTTSAVAYNATAGTLQTALEALSTVAVGDVAVTGGPGATNPYRIQIGGAYNDTATPTITASGASLTGTGAAATLANMSPSPIEYTLQPVQGPDLDLYLADTYAGLAGASRFTQGFGGSWKLGARQEPAYFIDSTQESWGEAVEGDPTGEVTLRVAADDVGMTLLDKIRTTNTLFMRVIAIGQLIESVTPDYYHTMRIDSALKVVSISEKSVEGQVVAYDFTCQIAHDPTWGQAFEVFVRTNLGALGAAALS